jgi:DNA-binding transcriptional LysR family regulator
MDLADLDIFRAVVQAGGITRAAEKLNRVQSNVTTRVRQLEADLGVQLFIREGKKLHLSFEGKLLLDYAEAAPPFTRSTRGRAGRQATRTFAPGCDGKHGC